MDPLASRDIFEIRIERHRASSTVVTTNRGADEWLATFADPVRVLAAIGRFRGNASNLVVEGESYRERQKPSRHRCHRAGCGRRR